MFGLVILYRGTDVEITDHKIKAITVSYKKGYKYRYLVNAVDATEQIWIYSNQKYEIGDVMTFKKEGINEDN
jgi:hypothetical protein